MLVIKAARTESVIGLVLTQESLFLAEDTSRGEVSLQQIGYVAPVLYTGAQTNFSP